MPADVAVSLSVHPLAVRPFVQDDHDVRPDVSAFPVGGEIGFSRPREGAHLDQAEFLLTWQHVEVLGREIVVVAIDAEHDLAALDLAADHTLGREAVLAFIFGRIAIPVDPAELAAVLVDDTTLPAFGAIAHVPRARAFA